MVNSSAAIYEKISLELLYLVDDDFVTPTLELLENSNTDEKLTLFENTIQKIEEFSTSIISHQKNCSIFHDMNELKESVILINEIDNTINMPINIDNLLILIDLAGFILEKIEDINMDLSNISFNEFHLLENVSNEINIQCFFHHNSTFLDRSILYFHGKSSLENLVSSGLTPTLAAVILALIPENCDLSSSNFLILKKSIAKKSAAQALALLKLFIVCSGQKFHSVRELPKRNLSYFIDRIDFQLNYQQFNESFIIISEYNSRKELLNKYLSLYHMVENFMFKHPLVKLNKERGGDMFSIRDFKDMYNKVDSSELASLESFLKIAMSENYNGISLLDNSYKSFVELVTTGTMTESNIDIVFQTLNIGSKSALHKYSTLATNQSKQSFPQVISKLIYIIRNSIVHNKETEFHLSHETLNDNICNFIEKYLAPQMENILFTLLTQKNNVVWYEHQNIKLFA
ncbi:hypothetical protein VSVS12_03738 [Vibrio scophthalmi]|uniref:hypothetical protein n=1 Tax=Vibrio scophthalmi TaxID=45658 RepID=UPI00080940B0|nr:hypothetical protein [Vibrio scophthalmi]ANS87438.1 hypothetical protein VSVS12_03738 [Vibrio scophthalmi]